MRNPFAVIPPSTRSEHQTSAPSCRFQMLRAPRIVFWSSTIMLAALAATARGQANLDAGKSAAQIFSDTCNACHRSPREIRYYRHARGYDDGSLSGERRQRSAGGATATSTGIGNGASRPGPAHPTCNARGGGIGSVETGCACASAAPGQCRRFPTGPHGHRFRTTRTVHSKSKIAAAVGKQGACVSVRCRSGCGATRRNRRSEAVFVPRFRGMTTR